MWDLSYFSSVLIVDGYKYNVNVICCGDDIGE